MYPTDVPTLEQCEGGHIRLQRPGGRQRVKQFDHAFLTGLVGRE